MKKILCMLLALCLLFALAWTALMPVAVRIIAPWLLPMFAAISPAVTYGVWMLFAADWLCSRYLLLRSRDTELLTLSCVLPEIWKRPQH